MVNIQCHSILIWVVFSVLTGPAVAAQKRSTVLILHTGQDGVVAALDAEISALGLTAVVATSDDSLGNLPNPEGMTQQIGAVAAIQVRPSARSVEVWIPDRFGGRSHVREVGIEEESSRAEALLALKVVECLRMELLGIGEETDTQGQSDESPSGELPPHPEERASPRVSLGLQPTLTFGAGGLPPTMHLNISCRARIIEHFGVRLFGQVPTFPMNIEENEGSADVRIGVVGGEVFYALPPYVRRIQPFIGLAMGAGFMRIRSNADGELRDKELVLVFPVGLLSSAFVVSITPVLSIRTDFNIGMSLKRPVVRFVGRDVSCWGRPIVIGMLGIEAWLF